MSDTREIILAGESFAIPALPLRINRVVYPLCARLTWHKDPADPERASFLDRCVAAHGLGECSTDEMDILADIAFHAVSASDHPIDRQAFDDMPIVAGELLDAFFAIRYQTGAWRPAPVSEGSDAGEAMGKAKRPRK